MSDTAVLRRCGSRCRNVNLVDEAVAVERGHAVDSAEVTDSTRSWRALLCFPVWVAAAIAGGVFVRLVRWSNGGSLNSDELWIAMNLQRRSFLGLRGALDYDQLAPLGWLWLEKLILTLGRSDAVLRFPALVAGCAVVGLTAVLARRCSPLH